MWSELFQCAVYMHHCINQNSHLTTVWDAIDWWKHQVVYQDWVRVRCQTSVWHALFSSCLQRRWLPCCCTRNLWASKTSLTTNVWGKCCRLEQRKNWISLYLVELGKGPCRKGLILQPGARWEHHLRCPVRLYSGTKTHAQKRTKTL